MAASLASSRASASVYVPAAPLPSTLPKQVTALIVIDMQQGFDEHAHWGGARNNPQAETNVRSLLDAFRSAKRPVWHVHHHSLEDGCPLNPDVSSEGFAPIALCAPIDGERRLTKHVNSCFIGTTLEAELRERGITTLVLCGLTTNHCVSTTTRMAGNLGFGTYLVGDACATFDRVGVDGRKWHAEDVHQCSLSDLHREFAWVVTTEEVIRAV